MNDFLLFFSLYSDQLENKCHRLSTISVIIILHPSQSTYLNICMWVHICGEDTAWSKSKQLADLGREAWDFIIARSLSAQPILSARGCAPECGECVYHINILFSTFALTSEQLWLRYSQQGQLLQKSPPNMQLLCHKTLHHRQPITRQESWGFVWHRPRE